MSLRQERSKYKWKSSTSTPTTTWKLIWRKPAFLGPILSGISQGTIQYYIFLIRTFSYRKRHKQAGSEETKTSLYWILVAFHGRKKWFLRIEIGFSLFCRKMSRKVTYCFIRAKNEKLTLGNYLVSGRASRFMKLAEQLQASSQHARMLQFSITTGGTQAHVRENLDSRSRTPYKFPLGQGCLLDVACHKLDSWEKRRWLFVGSQPGENPIHPRRKGLTLVSGRWPDNIRTMARPFQI